MLATVDAQDRTPEELAKLIPISAIAEKNAGIKHTRPKSIELETTVFSIGRIQPIPNKHSVVSTRIAGRVISSPPIVGDFVKKGQKIIDIESRQPGSPPPVIPALAPSSGIVLESHVNLGQPVEPAQELMDIVDIRQVWAVAHIPESEVAKIKIGQEARIKVISLGDKTFRGQLIRFGTEADASAGTIEAIFLLDNKDMVLRPNMRVEFQVITKTRKVEMAIPKSAVQGGVLDAHVFIRDHELSNTFKKVPVELGESNDLYVEIMESSDGLNILSKVITKGAYFLTHTGSNKGSLKEKLDADHGHEHNEDGSEMTPAQKKAAEQKKLEAAGGGKGGVASRWFVLLIATNVITLALLIFTIFKKQDVA